jgi:hypothetical protein
VTTSHRILLFSIAASMCLILSPAMSSAAESQMSGASDKKSFKTVPFVPNPSDTQRGDLERMVDQCVQTVEREVPGGHLSANVAGGIVNTIGSDRERFTFWKCMSEKGQSLAPINK